jgi:hypothetical protein
VAAVPEEGGGHLGGLVVAAHAVGQTGVGVTRHETLGQVRDLLQEGADLNGTCAQTKKKRGRVSRRWRTDELKRVREREQVPRAQLRPTARGLAWETLI